MTQLRHQAARNGLYNPTREHDSCGVGFIAHMRGEKSHDIVADGLQILRNLTHRGAAGADPLVGDGAGMLVQIPDQFLRAEMAAQGVRLPQAGSYGVGFCFFAQDRTARQCAEALIEAEVVKSGLSMLGWRDVPCDNRCLSRNINIARSEPVSRQFFVAGTPPGPEDPGSLERQLYMLRKQVSAALHRQSAGAQDLQEAAGSTEHNSDAAGCPTCIPSLSSRTLVYKGMFLADQLSRYFPDLEDRRFASALALVHQRFSTNTFPSWELAHPYRMVAHNGEINTLRGNVNWMAARQASVSSSLFGDDMSRLWPISYEGQSDTACFDNALEFLVMGGYELAHAAMMLVPEAWAANPLMDEDQRAFYEYHAALMEPWDGPAALAFTDGRQIGAMLDRNGLRPARYIVTHDDIVLMASENGVLPIEESRIAVKWRLQPGKMLLVDLEAGRLISDGEVKGRLARAHPYREWLSRTQIVLEDLAPVRGRPPHDGEPLLTRQLAFGYTQEDLKLLMQPMASVGQEAIGSMGTDTPLSALSHNPRLLYTYFKQNFAQVTNPPIDPIREELVMSLVSFIGPRPNLFDLQGLSNVKRLEVRQPILTDLDLEKIRAIGDMADNQFSASTLDITYNAQKGAGGLEPALERLCARAERAVHDGNNIVILSDRLTARARIAIPALLAVAAVHHHLIRCGLRTSVGLVVETGEAREVHHFCVLAGYGAEAINPYLAFETLLSMLDKGEFPREVDETCLIQRYIKAINKGILKVMSKMGISTYQSYCGAQIFDAIGLDRDFIDKYFTGTHSHLSGTDLAGIAEETAQRHARAYGDLPVLRGALDVGGDYNFRMRGEPHVWEPDLIATLQHAVRAGVPEKYRQYAQAVNENGARHALRGLMRLPGEAGNERPAPAAIPLPEVEPARDIVKRFSTGAMSYGSISREAHTTLARAMNFLGGKSNTGEGGEEVERLHPLPDGSANPDRSAIKQVASGRFGVTGEYLVNADMIQIKIAQGAKPGEGGQLPGHKVDAVIARVRHSTPGVGLISPPPHHDIYSIEDLAQLIFDLKNVNPEALISVKLVSEFGVGTVAAGVAKAYADHITISGYDGGTGASPLTSIKHAGSPWEIGLAETQQTLVANGLRARTILQVDGGLRTGRDVIIGALLGADEFGFSTAPLIAAGCLMMRKCHLNTCPVGIATQDPVLRKRFRGTDEHVINFFFYVAEEVREILASLGLRSLDEAIGRADLLEQRILHDHWKARGLDLRPVFHVPDTARAAQRHSAAQNHPIDNVLDRRLIDKCMPALENREAVRFSCPIENHDRSTGAMLSGQIARRFGHEGLEPDTIQIDFKGAAGQSFGAFLACGVSFTLDGAGNDYVGKGLSGGRIAIRPPEALSIAAGQAIIVGNTVLYGATGGECYFCGVAGERFAVRNSGATAVVEGVGDHGCEYMTGGVVVVIGPTGRNFAAGMSGGIAYVLDEDNGFRTRCNLAMVELEPVVAEDDLLERLHHHGGDMETKGRVDLSANMTGHDDERLRSLLAAHLRHTQSRRARQILDDWPAWRDKFIKVMPTDYRRALQEMQEKARAVASRQGGASYAGRG